MPKVSNVEVFGLASSIYRSGYPMMDHAPSEEEFQRGVAEVEMALLREDWEHPHLKRATHLANAKDGGHDQFLTGIVVNFDLTISNKAWVEAERYTFLNFISSMSTMHRAAVRPIKDCCNEYVEPEDVAIITTYILVLQFLCRKGSCHGKGKTRFKKQTTGKG